MRALGTFYELMVFFDKVSHLDRIVSVSNFDFNTPRLRNQKILLQSLPSTTYRYIEQQKAPQKR